MERELMIPPEAAAAPDGFEILRVWAAGDEQHVTIRSDLNGGASEFGFLLAQLARHAARVYHEREGIAVSDALRELREAFDEEWDNPTATPSGRLLE